jgi:hypothetical protein
MDGTTRGRGRMSFRISKGFVIVLSTLIAYISLNSLVHTFYPDLFVWSEEDLEESEWLATSNSWLDRKLCRFFGLCGIAHVRLDLASVVRKEALGQKHLHNDSDSEYWPFDWTMANQTADDWSDDEKRLREIPEYVLEYAPLVHLFSGESFWPGDIAEHLMHMTPQLNYTPVQAKWDHPTLGNLDMLNQWDLGKHLYLTSNDNVEDRPDWLGGEQNIPEPGRPGHHNPDEPSKEDPDDGDLGQAKDDRGKWYDAGDWDDDVGARVADEAVSVDAEELRKRYGGKPIQGDTENGGRSDAPAVLVVVDKGHGVVDAFWFYFYSYNLGNTVLNVRFGNHVGDWEHCMVRFYKGQPKALFFSAHTAGEAYSYDAVEKRGKRVKSRPSVICKMMEANEFPLQPVIYSATGTHAMYATPGIQEYVLPWGLLHDQTDRGPLWDPLLNSHSYTYNYLTDALRASHLSPMAPTEWFYFNGRWGDKFYPLGDRRQYRFAGQYHYSNGPLGPRFKHLGRRKVCQGGFDDQCVIRNFIDEQKRAKRWAGVGAGQDPEDESLESITSRRVSTMAHHG